MGVEGNKNKRNKKMEFDLRYLFKDFFKAKKYFIEESQFYNKLNNKKNIHKSISKNKLFKLPRKSVWVRDKDIELIQGQFHEHEKVLKDLMNLCLNTKIVYKSKSTIIFYKYTKRSKKLNEFLNDCKDLQKTHEYLEKHINFINDHLKDIQFNQDLSYC